MLKFITEEYLREEYRKAPFEDFKIDKKQKLTPGGRQYLLDKKISIIYDTEEISKEKKVEEKSIKKIEIYKLKSFEMEIYSLVSQFLYKNLDVAHELLEVGRIIKNICEFLGGKKELLKNEMDDEEIQLEEIDNLENYLYFKDGKNIFLLKKIFYEILFFREGLEEKNELCVILKVVTKKLEKIIFKLVEEI
ncbi:MAG: hypothetical protein ACRC1R_01945 [Cetobacterium sp.]|uniref:hypothetical protein n=1 Tax=Cetobacterium sp. TaxID=2071632 RepID=UPI003F3D93F5